MTQNKIALFRNMLAEGGMEMTMDEAAKVYLMADDIVSRAKKMSVEDMWDILDLEAEGMSHEDKEQIVELYRTAKEI
jgi:hypothetical protein